MTVARYAEVGKDAQQRARANGPFVIQLNPRSSGGSFYGFTSSSEASAFATERALAGDDVNERIDGAGPCRPFIDFDYAGVGKRQAPQVLAILREAVRTALNDLGALSLRLATYGYVTTCSTKISFHVICCDVDVSDGYSARVFAETVRALLPEDLRAAVDPIGNLKSFGLRIPACAKAGDWSRALIRVADEDGEDIWQLQDGEPRQRIGPPPSALCAIPPNCEDAQLSEVSAKVAAIAAETMPWFGPATAVSVPDKPYIVAVLNRIASHHCDSCGRIHDNRNAFISVDEDGTSAFLNCFAATTGSKKLLSVIMDPAVDAPLADEYDILDSLHSATSDAVERVNGQYNSDVVKDDGVSDLYIGSAWGTGKSHHNRGIIAATVAKNKDAKILIVSARKSLSAQMCADLGAVSYMAIKGMLDPAQHRITVWQIESLKRVDSALKFDLIICDELGSLADHTYSRSNNATARAGMSSLRCLLASASRIVVSDNDLTSAQVNAVRSLRRGCKMTVVRNEFQPWAGITAKVHSGPTGCSSVEKNLLNRLNEQFAAREQGQPWHGTVVPCHSRKFADKLAKECRARYGSDLVKLYTGESCDHMKRVDFSDAATAWANKLVVIYTATVSVGVNANIQHFDQVFAFFCSGNASAASSAQMLFRARQIKDITIAYTGSKRVFGLPMTRDALLNWATKAQHRTVIPDEFRNDRCPSIAIDSASDPKALDKVIAGFEGQIWVNAMLEQYRSQSDFIGRLASILSRAGIDVVAAAAADVPLIAAPTPVSNEEPEPSREQKMAEAIPTAIERACEGLDSERDRTETEKHGDRALELINVYNVDIRDAAITPEWIEYHEPNVDERRRLNRIINQTTRAGDGLMVASEAEACELSVTTIAALGHDIKTMRSGATASKEVLQEAFNKIGPIINKNALRLYGDTNGSRRSKGAGSFKAQLATMRSALEYIGLRLEATYKNASDKKYQRFPIGLELNYVWDKSELSPRIGFPAENIRFI